MTNQQISMLASEGNTGIAVPRFPLRSEACCATPAFTHRQLGDTAGAAPMRELYPREGSLQL